MMGHLEIWPKSGASFLSVVLRMAFMGTKERMDAKRAYELRFAHKEAYDYGNLLRETKTHHSEDYLEGSRAFAQGRKPSM